MPNRCPTRPVEVVDDRFASDARTLEELYQQHFDFVHRIARKLGGDELHAEEIAQDVFLVVARKLDTFQPASARVTTWLYSITWNIVRSQRRRARLEALFRADEAEAAHVAAHHADAAELAQAWKIADRILRTMTDKKRDMFALSEFEGLSCADIAEIVGTKEETVWSRLHYARKEFAAKLEQLQPRNEPAKRASRTGRRGKRRSLPASSSGRDACLSAPSASSARCGDAARG
jgi:RNA polymerase sigma-70 factor (ECF subfamily)